MKPVARAIAAGAIASYAIAGAASTQVPPDRTITKMGLYSSLGYIEFTPAIPGLEGCSYTAGDQVGIDWSTDANAKTIYATALAAYLAGQKVGFGVSGCNAGGLPLVYRVDVVQ